MNAAALFPPTAPIGIFDSGLGGLSVLRHVRSQLPHEDLLYVADGGFAPYGGRPEVEIVERTLAIAAFLRAQQAKAIVVACNTATTAAIAALREACPGLPVVGVEPGLKPAAAHTRSGVVGLLATAATAASARVGALQVALAAQTGVRIVSQGCPGLADQVEKGELHSRATARLLRGYLAPLLEAGADVLVLGCTHYPFLSPLITEVCADLGKPDIVVLETGAPVARQLQRVLQEQQLLRKEGLGSLSAFTTGDPSVLQNGMARLLGLKVPVTGLA